MKTLTYKSRTKTRMMTVSFKQLWRMYHSISNSIKKLIPSGFGISYGVGAKYEYDGKDVIYPKDMTEARSNAKDEFNATNRFTFGPDSVKYTEYKRFSILRTQYFLGRYAEPEDDELGEIVLNIYNRYQNIKTLFYGTFENENMQIIRYKPNIISKKYDKEFKNYYLVITLIINHQN